MEQKILQELSEIKRYTLIGAKTTLTIDEAAEYTGLGVSWIYNLTSNRQIPHYKRGRKVYFDRKELDEWLKGEKVDTTDGSDVKAEIRDYLNGI